MATAKPHIEVFSGNPAGQTAGSISFPTVTVSGTTVTTAVSLAQTNQPSASFQLYYKLDGGSPVATGVFLATDSTGSGTASFTITGVPSGQHSLGIVINNTPAPGTTYYITSSDIPFTIA